MWLACHGEVRVSRSTSAAARPLLMEAERLEPARSSWAARAASIAGWARSSESAFGGGRDGMSPERLLQLFELGEQAQRIECFGNAQELLLLGG